MKWSRKFPHSANNFDLELLNPGELDTKRMHSLLDAILEENHRNVTLSSRASQELRRWFDDPNTPLKGEALGLLSNWFLTNSGDRQSSVAVCCEDLWDALFPCRPTGRLTSPEPGRNHVVIANEFEKFWLRVSQLQDKNVQDKPSGPQDEQNGGQRLQGCLESESTDPVAQELVRVKFQICGEPGEVEGSPRAVADLLKRMRNAPLG